MASPQGGRLVRDNAQTGDEWFHLLLAAMAAAVPLVIGTMVVALIAAAWPAIQRFGDSLRRFAAAYGKQGLYHETITWAYLLLLNERIPGVRLYRVLTFFPAIVPIIVVPILWQFLLHPYGLVNLGFGIFGFPPIDWLRDTSAVIPGFILATDWRLVPLFSIVYLAGIQSIPESLYEAAKIDGATILQRFRWITFPLLRPTMLVVVIIATIFTAKSFTLAYVLTGGGPDNATTTLPLFIFRSAFQYFRVGYASAAAMVLLAAMIIITMAPRQNSRFIGSGPIT